MWSLSQLLNSALVPQKQPQTICKQMSMAVSQQALFMGMKIKALISYNFHVSQTLILLNLFSTF